MVELNCFMCQQNVPGALNGLVRHLINVHGLTITRGLGNQGFQCAQNGCRRRFLTFHSLRRHITQVHLNHGVNRELEALDQHDAVVGEHDVSINHHDENINIDLDNEENRNANFITTHGEHYNFNLRTNVVKMIARLQCKESITGKILTEVLYEFEDLLLTTTKFLENKVYNFFQQKGLLDDIEANGVLNSFQFENPFDDVKTLDGQIKVLQSSCGYIMPIEIPLGYRMDTALHRETSTYRPKLVMETCQYVPIIKTLELILSSPQIFHVIQSERKSPNGMLASFLDGQHAQIHPLFLRYPTAIRIQLYYDELEIVGALGSKTGVHKIGAFYFTIQNLPVHMNSELSSIHVLCLCSSVDVKKYGFEAILTPFFEDLAKLECDDGVLINIGGNDFVLRGSLAAFSGDGLAVHEIYNFLGPSANQFCRMCMFSRHDLHNNVLYVGQERTEAIYNEHLHFLERNHFSAESMTTTGVRGYTCLHSSRYFHISRNKIFDPMHDFLCGICPMILKLILHEFVLNQKKFTVDYFNARVSSFSYGYTEKANKPSANFTDAMLRKNDHLLSQKAMQIWCLMRAFPFLVHGKIPDEDPHMSLLIILIRIMELVFAPKITHSLLPYLQSLITSFQVNFQNLFPNFNTINEIHHISHYPECILWSGPLIIYWCMRYESKHGAIKARAQNMRNFRNPTKTLIRLCQCSQSAKWGTKDVELHRCITLSGKLILVSIASSKEFLNNLGHNDGDEVYRHKSVRVDGVEHRVGLYVCLETAVTRDDDFPLFGCVAEIIELNNREIYLLILLYKTILFDTELNAYNIIADDNSYRFIKISNLSHFKPFSCWTKPGCTELYISLRHVLL